MQTSANSFARLLSTSSSAKCSSTASTGEHEPRRQHRAVCPQRQQQPDERECRREEHDGQEEEVGPEAALPEPVGARGVERERGRQSRERGPALPAQYGGSSEYQTPTALNAFQKAVFAGASSSAVSMSGTTSASTVAVKRCAPSADGSTSSESGKPSAVHEYDRLLAHQHEQLRLDDVQLARQPGRRLLEALAAELETVRAVDRHRVDVQPLQRLLQRLAGAAEEGDALLDLRGLRRVLEQKDVRERMARAEHGHVRLVTRTGRPRARAR